jgi:hypothetical protein
MRRSRSRTDTLGDMMLGLAGATAAALVTTTVFARRGQSPAT